MSWYPIPSGAVNVDLDFSYGSDVSIWGGCAVTLQDEFLYLGGGKSGHERQVSLKI